MLRLTVAGSGLGLAGSSGLVGLAMAATPAAAADAELGIATILDGKAQLLRDDDRLQFVEGTRLLSQDIVETAPDCRLLQIEFGDGLIVDLGPSTRLLIDPQFYGERGRFARVYLLSGWIKVKGPPVAKRSEKPPAEAAPIPLLASPAIDLLTASGSVVAMVNDSAVSMFVESGQAAVAERLNAKPLGATVPLSSGQFLQRAGQPKSVVSPRPSPAFIAQLPRSFLDTLPERAAMFKGRNPAPKVTGPITYADARDWLSVEWTLRRPAMKRWRSLTRDAEFRKALVDNMPAHPEWDRALFPEKYRQGN